MGDTDNESEVYGVFDVVTSLGVLRGAMCVTKRLDVVLRASTGSTFRQRFFFYITSSGPFLSCSAVYESVHPPNISSVLTVIKSCSEFLLS